MAVRNKEDLHLKLHLSVARETNAGDCKVVHDRQLRHLSAADMS